MLALLGAIVATLFGWRFERDWRAQKDATNALESRRLALEERRVTLEERRLATTLDPEEMPADLRVRVDAETEGWAKDQMAALIRELHREHRSWDAVRQALGHLDILVTQREPGWSQTRTVS